MKSATHRSCAFFVRKIMYYQFRSKETTNKEKGNEMKKAIEVNNLQKKYGEFTAVNNISFSVEQGELFAFLGENGAGKSTTINMLSTILPKTKCFFCLMPVITRMSLR